MPSRLALSFIVVLLFAAVLPASASAQATRTWVSGVGDDANPCSRTAPCRTFAGAISKTAARGEINALDSGGFGAVTINKALTIAGRGLTVGVLTNVSNGITVNAGADDRVTLRGLDINGLDSNFHGIRILQAKFVRVEDTEIFAFRRNGISFEPTNAGARLVVQDTRIEGNGGNGVMAAPQPTGSGRATVRRSDIDGNGGCGLVAANFGPLPSFNYAQDCGVEVSGTARSASINSTNTNVTNHDGAGIASIGPNAVNRIGRNDVFDNAIGLNAVAGGAILSYGNNHVDGNDVDGNPTGRVSSR